MSKLDNVRISLKIDDLSNWNNNSNIILNNGEVALVRLPSNQIKIKVGDGNSQISDLNYINEQEFFTSKLSAYNAEFGLRNFAQQYSVSEGHFVSAYGAFQHAAGFNTEAISGQNFAFVWNGTGLYGPTNTYKSHGAGTFSINPLSGLSGFYIGEEHLAEILYNNISNEIEPLKNSINQNIATLNTNIKNINEATTSLATNFTIVDGKVNELSQDIENKILIDGEKVDQFEVKHVSRDEYYSLVNSEEGALSNAIYIVSSDALNMYGEQIKNVADGTDLSDAVNLNQLCAAVQSIKIPEIPTKVSVFENDAKYVNETQLNNAINNIPKIPTKISEFENDLSLAKIKIDNQHIEELEIKYISRDDYYDLVNNETGVLSNTLYIVSADNLNAYGQKIVNVAPGTDLSDAVNLEQMQSTIAQVNENLNDEIANINSSLNNYATKSELTNNVTQLNNDINILKSNDNILSSVVDNKILVDNISVDTFEVKHISQDDYNDLVVNDATLSNAIYIISSDTLNMYGEQIKNLADGTETTDAVNLGQVSSSISTVEKTLDNKINQINSKISDYALSNDVKNITNILANNIDNKILIDNISVDQLEVKHVSRDEYYELIANDEELLSNTLYIISGDSLNAYGQKIENVLSGTEDTDGVNLRQVNLLIAEKTDEITNSINNLQTNIDNNQINITQLSTKTNTLSTNVNTLSTNVKTLSSNFSTLSSRTNTLSSNVKTLSSDVKTAKTNISNLSAKVNTIEKNIGNTGSSNKSIQIIKPESDYQLYIEVEISQSTDFSEIQYSFNSHDNYEYFMIFNSTSWINSEYDGFGPEYNNKPVLINLNSFNIDNSSFIRYRWYYKTANWDDTIGNYEHVYSDYYSTVLGASTEVGANSSVNYATKIDVEKNSSYKLVDVELTYNEFEYYSCNIENKTISKITIDSDSYPIIINFPPKKYNDYARDFIIQINVTLDSTDNLQIEWSGLDDNWNAVTDADDWAILEPGLNIISFIEMN